MLHPYNTPIKISGSDKEIERIEVSAEEVYAASQRTLDAMCAEMLQDAHRCPKCNGSGRRFLRLRQCGFCEGAGRMPNTWRLQYAQ